MKRLLTLVLVMCALMTTNALAARAGANAVVEKTHTHQYLFADVAGETAGDFLHMQFFDLGAPAALEDQAARIWAATDGTVAFAEMTAMSQTEKPTASALFAYLVVIDLEAATEVAWTKYEPAARGSGWDPSAALNESLTVRPCYLIIGATDNGSTCTAEMSAFTWTPAAIVNAVDPMTVASPGAVSEQAMVAGVTSSWSLNTVGTVYVDMSANKDATRFGACSTPTGRFAGNLSVVGGQCLASEI